MARLASFTAHVRPGRAPVLVREGSSFWALLFPLPWLLAHGLWLVSAIWLALAIAVAVLAVAAPLAGAVGAIALSLGTGVFARDLQRFTLGLRGYAEAAVVVAPAEDLALTRLLERQPDIAARAFTHRG